MKKTLFLIVMALSAILSGWAAPAMRGTFRVVQADGTLLTIELHGDEHHNWVTASDGTLLVNRQRAYYVADIDENGELKASDLLAHEPLLRSSSELAAAKRQADRRHLFEALAVRKAEAARRAAQVSEHGMYLPHKGAPRVLVILTAYQDVAFTVNEPVRAFEQYLNGSTQEDLGNDNQRNVTSVRKYFETCSKGQFAPQFDIVGPVTLPQTMAYYGYGGGKNNNELLGQMAKDALKLVKDQVNMRDYDNDNDGTAELVYLIFTGIGENQGGPAENLWAKVSTQYIALGDSMRLMRVGCGSEKFHSQRPDWINGTGVFIHEFSHALGLPDLYPTTTPGRKVNNQSMEAWDVMDYGLYNSNSYAPSPYTAWEQEAMGWQDIEPLEQNAQGLTMLPCAEEGGKAYKYVNPKNDLEFIVVENIQKRGLYSGAVGHGMLAYHVCYPNTIINIGDSPNNIVGKPAIAVIPADSMMISGYLKDDGVYTSKEYSNSLAGDPFPGSSNVTQLTDSMRLPNFRFYEDDDTHVGITLQNIQEDATTGIVTFDFLKNEATNGIRTIRQSGLLPSDNYYNLNGQRISAPSAKGRTIRIIKGRKVVL